MSAAAEQRRCATDSNPRKRCASAQLTHGARALPLHALRRALTPNSLCVLSPRLQVQSDLAVAQQAPRWSPSTRARAVATFAAALLGLRDSPSYRGRGGGGGGLRRRGCGSGQGVGQVLSRLGLARLGGLGAHAGRRGAGRPPRAARGHGPRLEMNGTRAGGRVSGAMLAVLAWPCASRSGQTG